MRFMAPSLLLTWALLAPQATLGAALPADGGDPGKAYRACLDAIAKKDKAGIIALCFPKGDPWLEKTNLDYFTPEVAEQLAATAAANWSMTFLFEQVIPELKERGMTDEQLDQMMVENPKRWLA